MIIKNYSIHSKLGNGLFGDVFIGTHNTTKERIAIKLSSNNNNWSLKNEAKCYLLLKNLPFIPKMRGFGKLNANHYIIMDLLGLSLESIKKNYTVFSQQIVFRWGLQLLTAIKHIHSKHISHRDLKPANILFDKNINNVFICDFGLSGSYMKTKKKHIPICNGTIGSIRYMSIHSHKNIIPVRRDDIESIGYILWELLEGTLPWTNKSSQVENIKHSTLPSNPHLKLFILHARSLSFSEAPDYLLLEAYLKRISTSNIT